MGASLDDAGRLWDWSNLIQRQFGMSVLEERAQIEQAVTEFYEYAGDLLDRRREDPGEDLISTLIAAEEAGDRLSDVELVNLVLNVLVGGVDTTQSQLAHALRLFADHPDQWERLAAEPELAPKAVDEVLRFEPITPFTARIAMEDVVYRDVTFPEGTVVLVCAFTGNRDGEPDAFDITAERKAKPLTFGAGVHYCLGANLARAELQEALTFLAPRMPGPRARRRARVRHDRRHLRARRAARPLDRALSAAVARPRDVVAVPEPAALRRPALGRVVDVDDPEPLRVAVLPLEVVEQRPRVVAPHVDPVGDRALERGEVVAQVGHALRVVDAPVDDLLAVEGGAVLGDVDGDVAVVAPQPQQQRVQPVGVDLPPHCGQRRARAGLDQPERGRAAARRARAWACSS